MYDFEFKDALVGIDINGELILLKINVDEGYENALDLICGGDSFLGNCELYPDLQKLNPQKGDIYKVDIEARYFVDYETGYGYDNVFFDNFRKVEI